MAGSFTNPPAIALAANARTELTFKFDGTKWTMLAATGDSVHTGRILILYSKWERRCSRRWWSN